MALQKQKISVPLLTTLDTKGDPKQLAPGSALTLENVTFDSPNQLKKRHGFSGIGFSSMRDLMELPSSTLGGFSGSYLYGHIDTNNAYSTIGQLWTTKTDYSKVAVNSPSYNGNTENPIWGNIQVAGFNVVIYTNTAKNLSINITEASTGAKYYQVDDYLGTSIYCARIAAIGTVVFLFWKNSANNVYLVKFDISNPGNILVNDQLYFGNVLGLFNVLTYGPNIYITYIDTTPKINVAIIDVSGSIVLTQYVASVAGEVIRDTTISYPYVTVTTWDNSGTHLNVAFYNMITTSFLRYTAATRGGGNIPAQASAIWDSNASEFVVVYTNNLTLIIAASDVGTYSINTNIVRMNTAGTTTATSTINDGALCGSLTWISGLPIIPILKWSPLQTTIILYNYQTAGDTFTVLSTISPSTCSPFSMPTIDSLWSNLCQIYMIDSTTMLFSFRKEIGSTTGIFTATIKQNQSDSNYFSSAVLQNASHIANGMLQYTDGTQVVEDGFLFYPEEVSAPDISYGITGGMADGTYSWAAVYKWTDANGYEHRSAPSPAISKVSTGTYAGHGGYVNVTVPSLFHTNKGRLINIYIELYRTLANGTVYYLESTTLQSGIATVITSLEPDEYMAMQPTLYTTGGVLENIAPFPANIIKSYKDRIYTVIDDNLLQYSKLRISGEAVSWNDTQLLTVNEHGGPINGLEIMDDKIIIFKRDNAIFYITGGGPNNTGAQNDYSDAELIASDVGCINTDSTVISPAGVFFQSSKGICLLTRSLQVEYIGAPVEAYNNLTVTNAAVINNRNLVIFSTLEGTWLTYNYYVNKWATYPSLPAVDMQVLDGSLFYLSTNTTVYKQDTSFADGGSAAIPITLETGWMSFADVQGFQRVYNMIMLGTYKSAHNLTVQFAYDFNNTYTDSVTIDSATVYNGNAYEVRINPTKQKCTSIKVKLIDVPTALGESFALSNLFFTVGIKNANAGKQMPDSAKVAATE